MEKIYISSRTEWREWLEENHDKGIGGLWLVYYKKEAGMPTLGYDESVEEALCFGWIDSTIKKLDNNRYVRKFTPRNNSSFWSDLNKKRVQKLIKEDKMTKYGLLKVEVAKKSGLWEKKACSPISFETPKELEAALKNNKKAKDFFQELSPSDKKQFIAWIIMAKRDETKVKRIAESIGLLEKRQKLGLK